MFEDTDEESANEDNEDFNYDEEANSILKQDKNAFHSNNETNTNDNQDESMFQQNYDNLVEKMNVENLEDMMKKKKKNKKKEKALNNKAIDIENDNKSDEESDQESNDSDLDENNYRKLISEALAEDDAVEEFNKEKRDIIEKEKGKDVDNFLPGWGTWAGEGIKISKKRRNRFLKRAPDVIRKDKDHSNVIISEKKDEILNKFLPKTLPPGVKDFKTYQKKINRPIGSNWNPETVFMNITEPKIITKRGKIIDPMDKDALIGSRNNRINHIKF